jgi:hypothetical protein
MQELHTQPISDALSDEAEARVERKLHSDSLLDGLILSKLDDDGQPIPPESVREFEDFVAARPYRKELAERHGGNAADVIEAFSRYDYDLKTNGALAGEKLAGDYYANTNIAKMRHSVEKQKADVEPKPAKADEQDNVFAGVKLDRNIENAFDETDERAKEQAEFERAKEIFATVKAENPHLTFQEFFKNTTVADRELCRDPAFAYRLVAASGTPVTELQKEMAQLQVNQNQQVNYIESLITDMQSTGELVDFDRLAPTMMQILQDPNFVRSNDPRTDAILANRIAQRAELYRLREIDQQRAVEKARRAAPVRSTGGVHAAATGHSGSLDSSISAALAHLPDD